MLSVERILHRLLHHQAVRVATCPYILDHVERLLHRMVYVERVLLLIY